MSKNFKELYDKFISETNLSIIRPVDLELLKDYILETDLFENVLVFNIIHDRGQTKETLMRPNIDSFEKVVNINSISMVPSVDGKGYVFMVNCEDGTVLRNN
jgi:hypothetical protein